MAIINGDRDLLIQALFDIVGEDYQLAARILVKLETRFPVIAWRARFVALIVGRGEYTSSGLSINWWLSEVARLTDLAK